MLCFSCVMEELRGFKLRVEEAESRCRWAKFVERSLLASKRDAQFPPGTCFFPVVTRPQVVIQTGPCLRLHLDSRPDIPREPSFFFFYPCVR